MEPNVVSWDIQQLFIRPGDGYEYPMLAAQEAGITAKASLAKLLGDNSLVALDTQPKAKDINIKVKNGQFSLKLMTQLVGGTYTDNAPSSILGTPVAETDDLTMAGAITSFVAGGLGLLATDTYTFMARSASTYVVIPSSTGIPSAVQNVSSYPNTTLIPGISFVVNGTLGIGSTASCKTVAAADTGLEVGVQASNDFAAKLAVRIITENIQHQGQFEFFFPKCQSTGVTHPSKTKEYAMLDGEFEVLYDSTLGKSLEWRKYSRA